MAAPSQGEVVIASEADIVSVRKVARDMSTELGFGITDITRIVTAASELARNIYHYAGHGVMRWQCAVQGGRVGIEFVFEDHGPGIVDLEQALTPGYTTSKGLGMGLPGAKRLMDEMEVTSEVGKGTTVVVRKWKR
ncbi:MAG: anti-sigma regulatory factor [Armatimonadota bacterium]